MKCLYCQQELKMLKRVRVDYADKNNRYVPGSCKTCWCEYHVSEDKTRITLVRKVFIHNNIKWIMTYEGKRTFFYGVSKRKTPEQNLLSSIFGGPETHAFDGLVMPERFIELLAFL